MSEPLYHADCLRELARDLANGRSNDVWPWECVVLRTLTYYRLGEFFGSRRGSREHRVMACLLAALVIEDEFGEGVRSDG